uniref:Uncharacterized protein n=1 Tax=Cacopsylla melanoneura TaxID=428564 RepID=A0A8D8WV58_9HEMI
MELKITSDIQRIYKQKSASQQVTWKVTLLTTDTTFRSILSPTPLPSRSKSPFSKTLFKSHTYIRILIRNYLRCKARILMEKEKKKVGRGRRQEEEEEEEKEKEEEMEMEEEEEEKEEERRRAKARGGQRLRGFIIAIIGFFFFQIAESLVQAMH